MTSLNDCNKQASYNNRYNTPHNNTETSEEEPNQGRHSRQPQSKAKVILPRPATKHSKQSKIIDIIPQIIERQLQEQDES